MWSGLIRILSKIEWYFKFSLKNRKTLYTGCFCLTCPFYDHCRRTSEYVEKLFGEPLE